MFVYPHASASTDAKLAVSGFDNTNGTRRLHRRSCDSLTHLCLGRMRSVSRLLSSIEFESDNFTQCLIEPTSIAIRGNSGIFIWCLGTLRDPHPPRLHVNHRCGACNDEPQLLNSEPEVSELTFCNILRPHRQYIFGYLQTRYGH